MFTSSKYRLQGYIHYHSLGFYFNNIIRKSASLVLRAFTFKILYKEEMTEAASEINEMNQKLTASGELVNGDRRLFEAEEYGLSENNALILESWSEGTIEVEEYVQKLPRKFTTFVIVLDYIGFFALVSVLSFVYLP